MAPTPKKRRTRKGVLANISTNAPRLKPSVAKQPPKKAAVKRRLNTVDLAQTTRAQLPRLSLSTNIRFSPSADEHEGFRPIMGDMGKNQNFGIFREAADSPGKQPCSTVYDNY